MSMKPMPPCDSSNFSNSEPGPMGIFETSLSRSIKFWTLLFFQIPSILCSIFVVYCMLALPTYRRRLANHVIIAMLLVCLLSVTIDLSLTLNYLWNGIVKPQSRLFCLFWMYIDYTLYASGMLLTTWASFERHILVFATQYFRFSSRTIFAHYFPIVFCLIYPVLFYIYTIFFYPCQHDFLDFHKTLCGSPCFKNESTILEWYDMLVHSVFPSILIVTFSLVLLIRVIRKKRRVQQQLFSWKKQRRMAVQLLSIACLYTVMNLPLFIIILIQKCCHSMFARTEYTLYLFYFYYFLVLFLPFVCLISVGNLRKKIRKLKWAQTAQIHVING